MFKMLGVMVAGVLLVSFGAYFLSVSSLSWPAFNFQWPAINLTIEQSQLFLLVWALIAGGAISVGSAFAIIKLN